MEDIIAVWRAKAVQVDGLPVEHHKTGVACGTCFGGAICKRCFGDGRRRDGNGKKEEADCEDCGGTGYAPFRAQCPTCKGVCP